MGRGMRGQPAEHAQALEHTQAPEHTRVPAGRALLARAWRLPAVAGLVACGSVTALLGLRFAGRARGGRFDAAVDGWLTGAASGHLGVLKALETLGNPVPATVATAALMLACLVTRRWRGAVLAGVAVAAASVLTERVLKPLTGRTIQGWLSFPSGHATGMFALAVTCVVLLAGPSRPRLPAALRIWLAAGALMLAGAVATAMVALRLHYFTDIVGGAAVGAAMVLLVALVVDACLPAPAAAAVPAGRLGEDPVPAPRPGRV